MAKNAEEMADRFAMVGALQYGNAEAVTLAITAMRPPDALRCTRASEHSGQTGYVLVK